MLYCLELLKFSTKEIQGDSTTIKSKGFTVNSQHPHTPVPAIYKALTTHHAKHLCMATYLLFPTPL